MQYPGATLRSTGLVHDAYLRLAGVGDNPWNDRTHFYTEATVGHAVRMIDRARTRSRQRRGGGVVPLSLDEALLVVKVIELVFFGGLTQETARIPGISDATVERAT